MRRLHLIDRGIDEDPRENRAFSHFPHPLLELGGVEKNVESSPSRGLEPLRDERDAIGLRSEREPNHFLARGRHQVQLDTHRLAQESDVSFLDIAPVAAELDVDGGSSGLLRQVRGENRVRPARLPRLAKKRHGVEGDSELDHSASPIEDFAASSTLFASASISLLSGPSIMIRSRGSVPE